MPQSRTILLTDIHGCNATFQAMLEKLQPQPLDHFCFLGDYIDRGPDSKGVVDTIWNLEKHVKQVTCLMGNHEEKFVEAYEGKQGVLDAWFQHGGWDTLRSFGVQDVKDIPSDYMNFFAKGKLWAEVDGAILVHAGLNFQHDTDDPFYDTQMMRWIRGWYPYVNYNWLGDRIIVHGHTPIPLEQTAAMKESLTENQYLNLDTGCVYDYPGLGYLTAYDLTNRELISVRREK